MTEERFDARVLKSKKSLKKALFQLMEKTSFEKISVCDICKEAKINRMTFYNHYEDKYALFQDAINDLKIEIERKYSQEIVIYDFKKMVDCLLHLFKITSDTAYKYRKIIQSMNGSQEYFSLFQILTSVLEKSLRELLIMVNQKNPSSIELRVKFLIGGICSLINYYANHYDEINQEEYLAYGKELLLKSINEQRTLSK